MQNPFRSEAEAFRFVVITVGYCAAIVLATVAIHPWAGLITFLVLTGVGLWWLTRREEHVPMVVGSRAADRANLHRILVVANETVGGELLRREIEQRAHGKEEQVLVICPALNSRLRHWASDEDGARSAAQERLERSLARLRREGVDASGEIGDSDPIQAMEDALRLFGADEIIISTHPPGRSNWLEQGVVERAREKFLVPIYHVVTDLEAEAQRTPS